MHAALPALVILLTVGTLAAQKPIVPPPLRPIPAPATRAKPTQHKIVVQGCVQNGRLTISNSATDSLPFDMLNVSEFILEGPKELLRQIQEQHNRHDDEIAGIATVPPPPQDTDAAVETAKKGPVRITAGRRDEKSLGARSAPQQIKLRVASLTHISEGCVERP
jgi:hypothetical protein